MRPTPLQAQTAIKIFIHSSRDVIYFFSPPPTSYKIIRSLSTAVLNLIVCMQIPRWLSPWQFYVTVPRQAPPTPWRPTELTLYIEIRCRCCFESQPPLVSTLVALSQIRYSHPPPPPCCGRPLPISYLISCMYIAVGSRNSCCREIMPCSQDNFPHRIQIAKTTLQMSFTP